MTQKVGQGGTISLDAMFQESGSSELVDPDDPRVDIIDSDDVQLITDAVPTRVSLGHYVYSYLVAVDAPLGSWKAHWTGTINGAPVEGDDPFEVLLAGDIGFEGLPWITSGDVGVLLQTDLSADAYIDGLITHAQGLAEIEVGTQDSPSAGLKSILAQIVARMWQAGQSAQMNPAALQGDSAGPFSYQNPNAGAAGLGLTNREKNDLRKAAGKSGLWVQPLTRGPGLEVGRFRDGRRIPDPAELVDVVGGEPAPYIDPGDLQPL